MYNQKQLYVILIAFALAGGLFKMISQKTTNPVPSHIEEAFNTWAKTHKKTYASPNEKLFRLGVFYANALKVMSLNTQKDFTAKINRFADLTPSEFKIKYTGYRYQSKERTNTELKQSVRGVPASVDWRQEKGILNPVKDQGQCGSCWAFSTIGSIEPAYALKNKQLESFSEQQLVDCSTSYGNMGCNGGLMDYAFQYLEKYGFEHEADYPYTAMDGRCQYDETKVVAKVAGYQDVSQNDCDALQVAVVQQPISIAVDAESWQFYDSGIIKRNCGTSLDHGVVLVGYGTEGSTNYWIIRNSWSASWGEDGYVRVERKSGRSKGTCGECMVPSYPKL